MQLRDVFLFFLILCSFCIQAEDKTVDVNGKRMHFIVHRTSWYGAQAECAKRGLQMLSLGSKEESDVAKDIVANQQKGDFWMGLINRYEKKSVRYWHWLSTGEGLSYEGWCKREGQGFNENCALVSHGSEGCWEDWDCFETTTGLACEEKISLEGEGTKESEDAEANEDENTVRFVKSFYYFKKEVTALQAKEECNKLGYQFVTITSSMENQLVYDSFAKDKPDVWLGLKSTGTTSTKTTFLTEVKKVCPNIRPQYWDWWDPDEPAYYLNFCPSGQTPDLSKLCGGMTSSRNGCWEYWSCNAKKSAFVCQEMKKGVEEYCKKEISDSGGIETGMTGCREVEEEIYDSGGIDTGMTEEEIIEEEIQDSGGIDTGMTDYVIIKEEIHDSGGIETAMKEFADNDWNVHFTFDAKAGPYSK